MFRLCVYLFAPATFGGLSFATAPVQTNTAPFGFHRASRWGPHRPWRRVPALGRLNVNGQVLSAYACFTYNEQVPASTGRIPTTFAVTVPLSQTGDTLVEAVWSGIRGSNVVIDTPATLTAVIA